MLTGILGGSFDPPHNGHLYLGERFAQGLGLDRVLVIPAKQPPHKGPMLASERDRLEMCRLAFDAPYFSVTDLEMRRAGKSYTVDTLLQLKAQFPADSFYLLVGSDMLLYFDHWYRWRDILDMCTLCSFSRAAGESAARLRQYADDALDGRALILPVEPTPISSTQIRARLADGASVAGLMPSRVITYIEEHGLYRGRSSI